MTQATLSTRRLVLVPLAEEHFDFEVELDSDPEVMRYLSGRPRRPEEMADWHRRRLAAAHEADGLGFWVGLAEGEPIGWWLLRPPNGPDQPKVAGETELGYRLLRRFWRQGYASEGARALVRHGLADLGRTRVFAQTMAVNAGSRAVLASAGLTFARAFVSAEAYDEPVEGAEQGEVEYELTRAEWLASRPGDG